MQTKIKINDIDATVEVNRFVDVLEMHIEDLAAQTGQFLKNRLALRNYISVDVMDETEQYWGGCVWVPPGTVTVTTTDGHERVVEFGVFTQIVEVNPGIEGLELEPFFPLSPPNLDFLYDINNPQHLGFDIIATPKCTAESFEWGFNGGNGIMAFKELYDKHTKWDADKRHMRVIVYHNRYMGYHFDQANRSTILKYYRPKLKG